MLRTLLLRADQAPAEVDLDTWRAAPHQDGVAWVDAAGLDGARLDDLLVRLGVAPTLLAELEAADRAPALCVAGTQYGLRITTADLEDVHGIPHLRTRELTIVVGERFVLTSHPRGMALARAVEQRLAANDQVGRLGASAVLHVVLDTFLDHLAHLYDDLEQHAERLEDRLVQHPTRHALRQALALKRRVQELRRIVVALDEPLTTLVAADSPLATRSDAERSLFQTLNRRHDALLQRLDRLRDMAASATDLYLSSVSFRTSEQLRVLTFLSAVLLPMSVMAGIFGMNFPVAAFSDEAFGWLFFAALAGMGLSTAILLVTFHRRGWL